MMDPKLFAMLIDTFKIELSECHQEMVEALLQLEKCANAGEAQESLKQLFCISHNIKGSSKSVGIDSIAAIAHELEDSFSLWRENDHVPNKQEMDRCLTQTDQLLVLMEDYLNEMDTSNKPVETQENKAPDDLLKIPLSRVEIANAKANEFVTYRLKLSSWLKQLNHSLEHILTIEDSLTDEQRQLITSLGKLKDDGAQFYGEFSRSLNALQNELRSMRLLPINHMLMPLERTVRDVAGSLDKKIELKITGGDIELDKSILDLIKSPLQHLIRNSIGHGIEENDERKKLNKPIPAVLTINVSHASGKIQVIVKDDGQGLNVNKIAKRALSQNLIRQEQLDALNHDEKLDLIFLSGFSTKKNVTELSGRGVGLDIVRANIQKIKGSVNVKSTLNKGTSFCMKLPLTLATTRGLFITVNKHTLMLPTLSINTLYHVKTDDLKSINQQQVLIIDDVPIPVMLLSSVLNMQDTDNHNKAEYHGVMVGDHQQRMILLVDTISDEHDCVINPVPAPLNKVPHLIGVTLTGSGNLVLVLDVNCLMNYAITKDLNKVVKMDSPSAGPKKTQRILIVDDSITTRTLAVHSLEAAGYETMNAINGKLAWQLVQSEALTALLQTLICQ